MPILTILQYPDLRLGKKAKPVAEITVGVQKIIDDMIDTLHNTPNCAGLAATQLDIKNPPYITVIYDYRGCEDKPKTHQALCLVNPKIITAEGEAYEPEGCMSVPGGIYEAIKRAAKITFHALDYQGEPFEMEVEGFMAKLVQHEIDHLNGMIFIDRLSRLKRYRIDKKISKL
jgi:peptide deformylase